MNVVDSFMHYLLSVGKAHLLLPISSRTELTVDWANLDSICSPLRDYIVQIALSCRLDVYVKAEMRADWMPCCMDI